MVKIVYVGYNKTGITSMAKFFRKLNYKVWDYEEQMVYCHTQWQEIFNPATNKDRIYQLIKEMYQHVDVVTDAPLFFYWREVYHVFPEVKFIFYEREIESWFDSWKFQHANICEVNERIPTVISWPILWIIKNICRYPKLYDINNYIIGLCRLWFNDNIYIRRTLLGKQPYCIPELVCRRNYSQHNADFIRNCPKNNSLILKKFGNYDELCPFLGIEKPEFKFPVLNTRDKCDKVLKMVHGNSDGFCNHPDNVQHVVAHGFYRFKIFLLVVVLIILVWIFV